MKMSFTFAVLIFLTACSSTTNPFEPNGSISCDINGVRWEADTLQIAVFDDEFGNLSINGIRTNDQSNLLIDAHDISKGTAEFELADGEHGGVFFDYAQQKNYYTSEFRGGTLRITSWTNSRVKGTFSFDAHVLSDTTQTIQVRNGSFDLPFFL